MATDRGEYLIGVKYLNTVAAARPGGVEEAMADTMIRLGGLWKNQTRDGREYFSGSFGQAKILIFPNERKSKPSDPDYVLYFGERQERETQDRAGAGFPAGDSARAASAGRTSVQSAPDDVPF